ncbi:CAP domain-containing protein [Pseudovibrio sp. Tun.PSC04-5.I4]|uniref:CAP domain-containing protein n=1 Tax=Pseudovibrio sp. Tun.PSC04-5.I4 TaxID=1798213 RepID=UPI000890056D|nr:CAP domain-containing protein [Pseudovibrio sp. Tun.PSC04-5.I4]SDR28421.1 Uncharacterized conserved protein YkwD, contains CAP (CSP/antigen 5/PR1) domain [Pseudovibrio sp. Tun.PSC04-5.I4]
MSVSSRVRATPLVVLGFALFGCVSSPETPSYYQNLESSSAQVNAGVAAAMISSYRAQKGLSTVQVDPALTRIAQLQADGMAQAEDVNAARKGGLRLSVLTKDAGQGDIHAVNNVSAGYRRWAEAFSGWRDSKKHNVVMLDPKATRIGIATAYAPKSKYKVFWSLVVAEPK